MLIFILLLPIIFFIAAFLVNAAMFRPEKRPEANIDGRGVTFPSGRNHLAGYLWNEAGTRGLLVFAHGMGTGIAYYLPEIHHFAAQGYQVFAFAYSGYQGSTGHFYGFPQAVIDLKHALDFVDDGSRPVILMGHSMGSLAVRAFVAEHDSCVDMLIVCGSPSYNTAMPLGVAIAKTEKAVFGPRHRSKLIETMSFGAGAMKFRKDKRCTAWICSDPDVAKEYEESELCGFTFTDDAYLALFELMKRAYDVEHFSCTNPDMPVLFVSGAEDPCLINVRHFAKTVRAMRRAGYKDVKGKLYPGMRHEILNEIGREQVYHDIAVYMRKKGF